MKKLKIFLYIFFGAMFALPMIINFLTDDEKKGKVNKRSNYEQKKEPAEQIKQLTKKEAVAKTLKQLQKHLQKFNDEDMLFFAPQLPDNFEVDLKIDNLGHIKVKVWDKGNPSESEELIIKTEEK
ncbi:hypothetical protein QUF75_06345 [Desulfococcaceae bacterium HSG7]|nr:hypothetical protein [Desulfococcaceae bacterium HSG7]